MLLITDKQSIFFRKNSLGKCLYSNNSNNVPGGVSLVTVGTNKFRGPSSAPLTFSHNFFTVCLRLGPNRQAWKPKYAAVLVTAKRLMGLIGILLTCVVLLI